jgi:Holliday junction resolvasome RuvABC endonuclease subunit
LIITAGIDYSMTSPSICIHEGKNWSIDNCTFYYLVKKDKFLKITDKIKGFLYEDYNSPQQRFDNLSNWVIKNLNDRQVKYVGLEGYSYGSTSSRLFEIGENGGLLKYKMWSSGINFEIYAPTTIKKFACGKGNANKERLWECFLEETKLNLFHSIGQGVGKSWNPVSDMVDAYYICKYRHENFS